MNEKVNLLGKQQREIIAIPEWFMLYMIKARVLEPTPVPEEKVSALSYWRVTV